ncbi:MAG: filamentous hemagglutinin N-terminal domain-containing protein [Candidatus Omnitrophica bacterium]|nr:filamentous hemagglutinin N-terminal domain-containing protein [Candidatus Omnitrophota bacterium]
MLKSKLKIFCIIFLFSFFFISSSYSLPEVKEVIAGEAEFIKEGDNLVVDISTNKMIANYHSFSIGVREGVYFRQPDSSSVALNRVVGSEPSNIMGRLSANGKVFLVNPNGIVFGKDSRVDVGGLVASTLDISDEDFLSGRYRFSGRGSYIINEGDIKSSPGGYVVFISKVIDNGGYIEAKLGSVGLGCGEKVVLDLDDGGWISVVVEEALGEGLLDGSGNKVDTVINNRGKINADGGRVILTAKVLNKVFDYAINNSGIIEAKNLVEHNGEVQLVGEGADIINKGSILAGEVEVRGKESNFINEGEIFASKVDINIDESTINKGMVSTDGIADRINGGEILIDAKVVLQDGYISSNAYEGGRAGEIAIISTTETTLADSSTTEARALGLVGNGGRIIINSKSGNTFVDKGAVIDVSAGLLKGNAGFIEISAYKQLGFYGILSGRAPPGYKIATSIFDPQTLYISGEINSHLTVYSQDDIIINGDISLDSGIILVLLADHKSAKDWDIESPGIGAIVNQGNYLISAKEGATNTYLILEAGSGIGSSENPIFTNIHNLSVYQQSFLDGQPSEIYISQGNLPLNILGIYNFVSHGDIFIRAEDDINIYSSIVSIGDINISAKNIYLNSIADIVTSSSARISLESEGEITNKDLGKDFSWLGLLGYWSFDEGEGSIVYDLSGNGFNGSIIGNPSWVEGISVKALDFDGFTYVDVGSNLGLGSSPFTIVLWYKGTQNAAYVGLAGATVGWQVGYTMENHYGRLQSWVNDDKDLSNAYINDGVWHQLVMVRDGSQGSIYIDGILDSSFETSSGSVDSDYNFWIGGWGNPRYIPLRLTQGVIDEVRVYNRALSSQDIYYLFSFPIQLKGEGLISAGEVCLLAQKGIDVKLKANYLQAGNFGEGKLYINNIGDLTLKDILGYPGSLYNAGGDIYIYTSSNLYIEDNIYSEPDGSLITLSAGEDIVLDECNISSDVYDEDIEDFSPIIVDSISLYAGKDIIINNARITSFAEIYEEILPQIITGSIYLQAGRDIVLDSGLIYTEIYGGLESALAGDITLTTLGGDIKLNGYSSIYSIVEVYSDSNLEANSGNIYLDAYKGIVVEQEYQQEEGINIYSYAYGNGGYQSGEVVRVNSGEISLNTQDGDIILENINLGSRAVGSAMGGDIGSISIGQSGKVIIRAVGNIKISEGSSLILSKAEAYDAEEAIATSGDLEFYALGDISIDVDYLSEEGNIGSYAQAYNTYYGYAYSGKVSLEALGDINIGRNNIAPYIGSYASSYANIYGDDEPIAEAQSKEVSLVSQGNIYVANYLYSLAEESFPEMYRIGDVGDVVIKAERYIQLTGSGVFGKGIYLLADNNEDGQGSLYLDYGTNLIAYEHHLKGANISYLYEYIESDTNEDGFPESVDLYFDLDSEVYVVLFTPDETNLLSLELNSTSLNGIVIDSDVVRDDFISLSALGDIRGEEVVLKTPQLNLYANNINVVTDTDELYANAKGNIYVKDIGSITLQDINAEDTVQIYSIGDIWVNHVFANNITLTSEEGAIIDSNGEDINIEGDNLFLYANVIGEEENPLETSINCLEANSYESNINLVNDKDLCIRLVEGGSVYIHSLGDLYLGSIYAYYVELVSEGAIIGREDNLIGAYEINLQANNGIGDSSLGYPINTYTYSGFSVYAENKNSGSIHIVEHSPFNYFVVSNEAEEGMIIIEQVDGDEYAYLYLGNISTKKGDININSWGTIFIIGDEEEGGGIFSQGGNINLIANDFEIWAPIVSEQGNIVLANATDLRSIVIGKNTEDDDLEIDGNELNRIETKGVITIGSSSAGKINIYDSSLETDLVILSNDSINIDDLNVVGTITGVANGDSRLGAITTSGLSFINFRGDIIILGGTIESYGEVNIVATTGSILGEGEGKHIIAHNNVLLEAKDVIGLIEQPLDILLTNGELGVIIYGEIEGVSGVLEGSTPSGSIVLVNKPTGKVYFNNNEVVYYEPEPQPEPEPELEPEPKPEPIEDLIITKAFSQSTNLIILEKTNLSIVQLAQLYFRSFLPQGFLYFYHPLASIDMAGLEDFILEEGAYELIGERIENKSN